MENEIDIVKAREIEMGKNSGINLKLHRMQYMINIESAMYNNEKRVKKKEKKKKKKAIMISEIQ